VTRRVLGLLLAMGFVLAACTNGGTGTPTPPPNTSSPSASVPPSPESPSPAEQGPESALAAMKRLCTVPEPDLEGGSPVPAEGPTAPVIAELMVELPEIRGFDFSKPVVAEPVDQAEIARDLSAYADIAYPEDQMARRSLAWDTIGVVPDGTSLREAYEGYGSTQVIGYYDTLTGELKFIGTHDPSPLERITLAHELTHAIDDQRFGLEKLDVLAAECRDEETGAAIALVEGNATFFMLRWAQTYLSAEEQVEVGIEAALQEITTEGIPPFILRSQAWSYDEGLRFITALSSSGGVDAIDEAFLDPPVSTEQIIHPERYPNDVPTPVDVADQSEELGPGWDDLDVMLVGEAWLRIAMGLRLDATQAANAAAGWDGGTYRAWSDGEQAAVVLSTVWDSEEDASEFATAMISWLDGGEDLGLVVGPGGTSVDVLFATDPATLDALEAASA